MSETHKVHDVIVVGGGISGLYAARCLTKEGQDVIVLEAQDRVGGRSFTQWDPGCGFADLGGAYVASSQTKMISLVKELGGEVYELPTDGKSVLLVRENRIEYGMDSFPLKYVVSLVDLNDALRKIDAMSKEVPMMEPWNAPKAEEWDSMNVEQFFQQLFWSKLAGDFLKTILEATDLQPIRTTSLLSFLHGVRQEGGIRPYTGLSDQSMQAMKIVEGSSSVSERMAGELKGRVKLNSTVVSIDHAADVIDIRTEGGVTYKCRQVILATCPIVLRHIDIIPALPRSYQACVEHKPVSNVIKTVMYYNKPYWRENGLTGEFVALNEISSFGLDDTKADGTHPAIMCFVDETKYSHLTPRQRKHEVGKALAKVFRIPEMVDPVLHVEKEWGREETSRYHGICVYSSPPGFLTNHKALWGESVGKIHFAGTEASRTMRGYMEGGLWAAEAATAKVLKALAVTPSRQYETEAVATPFAQTRVVERLLPGLPGCAGILALVMAVLACYVSRM